MRSLRSFCQKGSRIVRAFSACTTLFAPGARLGLFGREELACHVHQEFLAALAPEKVLFGLFALGLYLVQILIERYGGRVWVEDRVPGATDAGAAFRFTLKKA